MMMMVVRILIKTRQQQLTEGGGGGDLARMNAQMDGWMAKRVNKQANERVTKQAAAAWTATATVAFSLDWRVRCACCSDVNAGY